MSKKREIEAKKGREILARLNEIPEPVLSAQQFIAANFDTLQQSGKTLRALYHFLSSNGIDVGSYLYFQEVYNGLKRGRKYNTPEPAAPAQLPASEQVIPIKAVPEPAATEKAVQASSVPLERVPGQGKSGLANTERAIKTEDKPGSTATAESKQRLPGQGVRPIRLPDGTELEIDSNGARHFKI